MRPPLPAASLAALASALLLVTCGPETPDDTQEDAVGYTNPVYEQNFPDPFVLEDDGTWYAYSTQSTPGTMPVLESQDLVSWTSVGNAMPEIAPWASVGRHWAPEVTKLGDQYLAYYTAQDSESRLQCLGVAIADSPEGPFEDTAEEPFICQRDQGGSIDASPFIDEDGTPYLIWKNDGNHIEETSWIYIQELSEDGMSLVGEPTQLITHDQDWEGVLVEGPYLWLRDGTYYLFYSANGYGSPEYGVGYAVADDVIGPYTKPLDEPILSTNEVAAGPGHGMVLETDTGTWYVHHAWPPDAVGDPVPGRQMWLTPLTWTEDGQPDIAEPALEVDARP